MTDTLLFALPALPDRERRETHWWHVVDGSVAASGSGDEWLALSEGERTIVALAPAGEVRLTFSESPEASICPLSTIAVIVPTPFA